MGPTIFIKFCGFIVHSNLNNMTLSAFPRKILLTRKIYFYFPSAPNEMPKPTDQSSSNSIFRVLLQLSPFPFSILDLSLIVGVVHIRKNQIFRFSQKMATTILITFCGFIVHFKLKNKTL